MYINVYYIIIVGILILFSNTSMAQSAKDIRGSSPLVAIENEAPPKLIVDQPLPEPLAQGRLPSIRGPYRYRSQTVWKS